jgi:hypothetical protein
MKLSTSQKGFAPMLVLVIVAIVGVAAYYGWINYKPAAKPEVNSPSPTNKVAESPSPTLGVVSSEQDKQILKDVVEGGVNCEFKTPDGNLAKDVCKVVKIVGNYAKGTMPLAYWMAVKTDGKWKVVVTGNGIPRCEEIDKYSIPKEIYGNCIEATEKLRY